MGDDDVVVIMERMTTTTTTTTKKDEEKETKITTVCITKELSSTDDQIAEIRNSNVVIAEDVEAVTKLFLGFSLWCAGYGIVYTVGMIILLDVNKVSAIVSLLPALLVSCLLLRWTHAYAVKLIDSYLINPGPSELIPENRRREFEGNITLRYSCPGLCILVDCIIIGVNKGWTQHRDFVMAVLSISLNFLLFAHFNWIRVYLNKKLIIMRGLPNPNHHPKEETTNNNNNIDKKIINIGSS